MSTPGTIGRALVLLLTAAPAWADEPPRQLVALSGAGGYDLLTRQPFAGLDVAFHHDGATGFGFVGRAQVGWGFRAMRPLARVEAGFAAVVPAQVIVRVGLVGGTGLFAAPYEVPLQVGGPPGADDWGHVAFQPYGMLLAELGDRRDAARGWAAWAVGVRMGAGLATGVSVCDPGEGRPCVPSGPAFAGGVTARLRLHEGGCFEVQAGPTSYGAVGYAF